MNSTRRPITIATRGSALALAQANLVFRQCCAAFPKLTFEIKTVKTTGDRLQKASLANPSESLPKGLFTKELETALLKHQADLAVHSLKDLPTRLPGGLKLGAVSQRADVRDVLVYRDAEFFDSQRANARLEESSPGRSERRGFRPKLPVSDLPHEATVATSSTRRRAQLLAERPDLNVVEIRGNLVTRLQKLADKPELDALVMAAAGLERLHVRIEADGRLRGDPVPAGLLAAVLELDEMLPCVGQGALGIEIRENDEHLAVICERLNHADTMQCVLAERAFLSAMGGGCHSPVGAYAEVIGGQIRLRAVSFQNEMVRHGEKRGPLTEPIALGELLAAELK